ncbi:MAG: polysaccharide deacetylase family protein [Erysipelotrichaceae bacterium]
MQFKRKKLALVLGVLIILNIVGLLYLNNKELPTYLHSTLSEVGYVSELSENEVVVYYPLLEDENAQDKGILLAQDVLHKAISFGYQETKIEFKKYENYESYYSYEYVLNNQGKEMTYYFFTDKQGNTFNRSHCDSFLRQQIALEARAYAKLDEDLKEVAYTQGFAHATIERALSSYQIYITDELVVYFEDYYLGKPLTFSMSLNEVGGHIDLNLGIETTNEVRIPKRVIDPKQPMVAFTFDDGPYGPATNKILDALYENDGTATFYVVGNRIENETPTILKTISLGNEIGSHSWSHPDMRKCDDEKLKYEFSQTATLIDELTGGLYKIKTFRPPYSFINEEIKNESPYPFILWNVDSEDWKSRDVDTIVEHTLKDVKDGSIILMHDMYETSVEAAVIMIDQLKKEGYQLVSVEELFEAKGVALENGKVYRYPIQ